MKAYIFSRLAGYKARERHLFESGVLDIEADERRTQYVMMADEAFDEEEKASS